MNPAPKGEYWDFSWNLLCGCNGGCPWCFARRMYVRKMTKCELCQKFEPHFHEQRMDEPLHRKKSAIIHCNLTGDTFGQTAETLLPYVRDRALPYITGQGIIGNTNYEQAWKEIRAVAKYAPLHTFLILTKQPQNIPQGWNDDLPNLWVGVSETGKSSDTWRRLALLQRISTRAFLSLEPLIPAPQQHPLYHLGWVIIGAMTGPKAKSWAPFPHARDRFRLACDESNIPLWEKSNLGPWWGENLIQQRPKEIVR